MIYFFQEIFLFHDHLFCHFFQYSGIYRILEIVILIFFSLIKVFLKIIFLDSFSGNANGNLFILLVVVFLSIKIGFFVLLLGN